MRWPWSTKRERRSGVYTDALVSYLENEAGGTTQARAGTSAAVEAAAGLWSRAFAAASVEGAPDDVTAAVSPAVLGMIGRELIRSGEIVFAIDMAGNGLRLTPASTHNLQGLTSDPASWTYEIDDSGPTGQRRRVLGSDGVVHCRYAVDPTAPWRGIGPIQAASSTSTILARSELALSRDARASVGYVLPAPAGGENADGEDEDDDQLGALLTRMKTLAGKLMVVDSMSSGWGAGRDAAPVTDWKQQRLGPTPDAVLAALRGEAGLAILGAAGVPISLVAGSAQASALRESFRIFLHSSVAPVARVVEAELRDKLDAPGLVLSHDRLFASDLSGRARAFQSMVGGGLSVGKAAALAGLMEAET